MTHPTIAMKLLGIKDKSVFYSIDDFRAAVVCMGACDFEPLSLPWYNSVRKRSSSACSRSYTLNFS